MMGTPAKKASRRTQHERSEITRKALMASTLECLGALGYARTTISEITKRSGLSRGALLHHFPTKNHLIVAAFMNRQEQQVTVFEALGNAKWQSVSKEIGKVRLTMEESFPVSNAFFYAMRTDPALRALFQQLCEQAEKPIAERYKKLKSNIDTAPDPLYSRYAIGCFIRGLCLEALVTDSPTVEKIYAHFVRIMTKFAAPAGSAGRGIT
jgi:AcrR family transcriptional regulator